MSLKIHPSAIVNKNAKLGENVEIGPFCVIGEDVEIGDGTLVGPNCVIEHCQIGKNNRFTAFVTAGTPPQDYAYKGEKKKLIVGDNNIFREGVSLHRGCKTDFTQIGNGCMLMAYSHVGHDCRLGNNVIIVNSTGLAGHVEIGDKAFISGLCGIHQFVKIGTMVMLGAGSMVSHDIPPYALAQGDRAKLVGLNVVGMRRNQISRDAMKALREAYKTMFLNGLSLEAAVKELQNSEFEEVKNFAEFCKNSERGVARPRMIRENRD
jgi:UDP-N-acetylglucosamine acyltransferase